MRNRDHIPAHDVAFASLNIKPPAIIARAGQEAVSIYAQLYSIFFNAQNDDFSVGVSDFLNWLEDKAPGMSLEHIVEDNVVAHLSELRHAKCSESGLSSRLCAIDMFLKSMRQVIPELGRIHRTAYGRLCPPLLLVENSAGDDDFVGVYINFLKSYSNRNTREGYSQGLDRFCDWILSDANGSSFPNMKDITVANMSDFILSISETDDVSGLSSDKARTVGAIFSSVRMYLDACIGSGILLKNVARSVRLPRIPTGEGRTPVLENSLVARMLDMIPMETEADYRDRAMIAMMAYSLFRISAVCRLQVKDYQMHGPQRYIVTIEKGSKVHRMPVHESLSYYIDDYLSKTGLLDQPEAPLFQGATPRTGALSGRAYSRNASWKMLQRRATAAGHYGAVGNHALRATGITNYLANGGELEKARVMAGHKSAETTRLYDRNIDVVDPEEVAKIRY